MKKIGYFGKQMLIYGSLLFLIVTILIFCAYSYVMEISRENAIINQEQLTTAALEKVDAYLDEIRLVATQVAHDSEIIATMEALYDPSNDPEENYFQKNEEALETISTILKQHNALDDSLFCIDVHNIYGDYACSDPSEERMAIGTQFYRENLVDHIEKTFLKERREFIMMGPPPRHLPSFAPSPSVYMIMAIKSYDGARVYGYLEVYRSLEPLFEQLEMDQETDMDVYLFYEVNRERGDQFYPQDQEFPDTSADNFHETERKSQYWWYVVLLQNQAEFLASYQYLLVYLTLGGFAIFLMLFLCGWFLVRYTSKPILELNSRVKAATLESLPDQPVTDKALDEVKTLERSFEHMIQRLKTSVELEQQAYLNAMQAQMKPHFLYNCLATISSMAVELDDDSIPEFCEHLTAILRYVSTYESSTVPLSDEIANVQNYLELMKVRYEDDLTYTIEVEESLLTLPLPRLVLQPLVENCFDHGFLTVAPPWNITVRAYAEDGMWSIQVLDNGCGFDQEMQLQLEQQVEKMTENLGETYEELNIGGLGLANTIIRFRLTRGTQVSYSITPLEPHGTAITLKGVLP